MDNKLDIFKKLFKIFEANNKKLFLVGGTVRDYLLNLELNDMDAVTDATPKEMKMFLKNADFTFEKYGSIKLIFNNVKFDITTLREERLYSDFRHPTKIRFVNDIKKDVKRRDFTINALYMDNNLKIVDFVDGIKDLQNKKIQIIGNADKRIKEDPLRILRAIRFSIDFGFDIEKGLIISIFKNISLIDNLSPEKVRQEIKKIKCNEYELIKEKFIFFNIGKFLNMVK